MDCQDSENDFVKYSQVRNKVHVRTMGEAVVSKDSETLYEDSPLSFLSPNQVASRVHLEHNYSFGESVTPDLQQECTSNTELADDLVIITFNHLHHMRNLFRLFDPFIILTSSSSEHWK